MKFAAWRERGSVASVGRTVDIGIIDRRSKVGVDDVGFGA